MWKTFAFPLCVFLLTDLLLKVVRCEDDFHKFTNSHGIFGEKRVASSPETSGYSIQEQLEKDPSSWVIENLGSMLVNAVSPIFQILFFPLFWLQTVHSQDDFPILTLAQGDVMGKKVYSLFTEPFYSFEGIPYAKPPTGDLRFKAPLDPEPWNGTFEALEEGSICKQYDQNARKYIGEEDCLFINVHTPELPGSYPLKPVMVWIHGGGFGVGSGNTDELGPDYLLSTGIVFVSFNYRLGFFGFFSTCDSAAPGNAGMKDQIQALRWVQQNIAAFGGDPNKVTIFGVSAGGGAVQLLMLSPLSKGLFQGAIAMSGSAISTWAIQRNPKDYVNRMIDVAGMSFSSSEELVETFRYADVKMLENISGAVTSEHADVNIQTVVFLPTVENYTSEEEPFLPAHPLQLLEEGMIIDVPFMTGMASHEGIVFLLKINLVTNSTDTSEIDKSLTRVFKHDLRFCYKDSCHKDAIPRIRQFYFGDKPINNETYDKYIELCTDLYFTEPTLEAAKLTASWNTSPVYVYQFSYDGGLVALKANLGFGNIPGASHGDDTGNLFSIPTNPLTEDKDLKTRSRMVTLWANFAKTGNPTPGTIAGFPTLPPYTSAETNYLNINTTLEVKVNLNSESMKFWENLYSYLKN